MNKEANAVKKKYLRSYLQEKSYEETLQEALDKAIADDQRQAIRYDKISVMSSSSGDLSDRIVKIEELTAELRKSIKESEEIRQDILRRIKRMPKDKKDLRKILIERYIIGGKDGKEKKWQEIADKMGYTERHVQNLHSDALELFPYP